MTDVERVICAQAELGESPRWDAASGELVFVDIVAGAILRWQPGSDRRDVQRQEFGEIVTAVVARSGGGEVLMLTAELATLTKDATMQRQVTVDANNGLTRLNDAACDPLGRLFVGTMTGARHPGGGALYRVEPDWSVHEVVTGTTISNGIAWSPDATTMYFADSHIGRVDAFDYDRTTGAMSKRRPFIQFGLRDGLPDGLVVDAEGCLWVAGFGGGHVSRYDRRGRLLTRVALPVDNVTSCCFGGSDLDELYITTARVDLDATRLQRQPYAGDVFRYRPDVTGMLDYAFAG